MWYEGRLGFAFAEGLVTNYTVTNKASPGACLRTPWNRHTYYINTDELSTESFPPRSVPGDRLHQKCKAFPWHSSLTWLSEAPTFLAVFKHWTRVGSVESAWWPSDAQAYDEATVKFRPASVVWQVVMASLWGRQRSFCVQACVARSSDTWSFFVSTLAVQNKTTIFFLPNVSTTLRQSSSVEIRSMRSTAGKNAKATGSEH